MHIDDETTLSDRWVPTKPLVIGSASASVCGVAAFTSICIAYCCLTDIMAWNTVNCTKSPSMLQF